MAQVSGAGSLFAFTSEPMDSSGHAILMHGPKSISEFLGSATPLTWRKHFNEGHQLGFPIPPTAQLGAQEHPTGC